MPRFYFNVHDGKSFPDEDGSELRDLRAARETAVRLAGDLLRDHAAAFWTGEEWRMEVTDKQGLILFCLTFVAQDAPTLAKG